MEDSEKADSEPIPKNDDASPSQGKSCALCGCATPAVRCDRCNSQIFCLSCDDMYHRHPKRKLHLRKAVDSIWTTARSPRLRRRTELPGDPCKIPIPPPRSKKRERHTIGGRMFLKSGLELGSFGHSKVFDPKSLPTSKDYFIGEKSPASLVESNCDVDTSSPIIRSETGQIYENDNITNPAGNLDDRSPWNPMRPNISSPIQVSIPSSSPDIVANGQSFGYPTKPHSQSAADLTGHAGHPIGHHPYHFHPPYPYMHPPMHPYSHSMAHLNCAQCISSSWSNLISPHPSPYFHPMPWGSAQNSLSRHPVPGQPMKHSHGDISSYPDSGFHYPYPGGGYFHNGPPVVDPNFIKDLHEQAEMQKLKKEVGPKSNPENEEMDTAVSPIIDNEPTSDSNAAISTEAVASANQDVPAVDEMPPAPVKPTEPWSCLHCTFINPPGVHICQVCCKTSYGNKLPEGSEELSEIRPQSRDSESPLINRDALLNSPEIAEFRDAQKDIDIRMESPILHVAEKLTTETQTFTTTKTTDVQTQNICRKSIASSTDSIFPRQEISVQTEIEEAIKNCSVATDPMISSQSLESLLSGVSAPPYHNRRAGWGRGATSFSTQSLYERGRSRSPMPRSLSFHTEAPNLGRDSSFASEEAVHSASQAWLYTDPMYYKPHNQGLVQSLTKEDYFDGTWGSMDRLNRRVNPKKGKEKVELVRPKLHRSLDDLKSEKRPEIVHTQELLMLQTVKEAERCGFTLEDLHVAYLHCGKENPVFWLEDNWPTMIKNVIALAAKYGEDNEENDVGVITTTEAKDALRIHRGDIWDAVAECIETRQRKILELTVRGNFTQKQISEALKHNEGNVELAYADLLRASTRRHKFILSPGLSTDSEDLNVYNPTEDTAVDHTISSAKAAKLDVSAESKTEKKKSDFLTKLTAIREAQSERRKAREEKELIRETITQDFPPSVESQITLQKDISLELTPSISREDSKEVEEILQDADVNVEVPIENIEVDVENVEVDVENIEVDVENKVDIENKVEVEISDDSKPVPSVKEAAEDSLPVDFDTNWSESQGEWIEEYSDEQWEEGDEHWVGLGKKFQKMEKEFEEEARQMAALWEKEELEDDVFEDDAKIQQEDEILADSDKKFDEWVKANLKVDSSEYEEELEVKVKTVDEGITSILVKENVERAGSQPSPLQHYPTAHDLSLKSQFESDWVDLPADAEIEKLAHDIVCEGSDVENKFDEGEMVEFEEEKHPRKLSDQGSDEDWEKIEMDEQLQEVNELDRFAFPEKEGEIEINGIDQSIIDERTINLSTGITSEIIIDKDESVLYKNLESAVDASDIGIEGHESLTEIPDKMLASDIREELPSIDKEQLPKVPVRRRSKLSSSTIDDIIKNQAAPEISSDIPPPLPEKNRQKDDQQKIPDIYAVPDKATKISQQEHISKVSETKDMPSVPQKPPRLNISSLTADQSVLQKSEEEREPNIPVKILSKDGSPVTPLSYESDSNFFADSESDTEIKLLRQKNLHRKPAKYENEFEDAEMENISGDKMEDITMEDKNDILESNFDIELDDDIDPALIEPLPRMKDVDFDPELPILLGGRGRQISDTDDVNAPKAFREDTTRPLQLFKATKRETSTETLPSPLESPADETAFIQKTNEMFPMSAMIPSAAEIPSKITDQSVYENQLTEKIYYNDTIAPQQSLPDAQMSDKLETTNQLQSQEYLLKKDGIEHELEEAVQPVETIQDEMAFTEMESLSAVADYFFGRYNEITVTRPKKKTPARTKTLLTSVDKSPVPTNSKIMSTSEIISNVQTEIPSQMEQSASAVLQETILSDSIQETIVSNEQAQQTEKSVVSEPLVPVSPPEKTKESVPSECLSFAEDYLFGCYSQVVPPRKTKNKPVVLARIPKLGESLSRTQSSPKEQKSFVSSPVSTPEPPELSTEEPEEEECLEEDHLEEEETEKDENVITIDSSVMYDDIFHDLPPEMLSNQSFDETSIYYESFQDAVEDVQSSGSAVDNNVVNVRSKCVHFEEPAAPVVPPRKQKPQSMQKSKAPASPVSSESYANEYLFRQYELGSQAKKKLPLCIEDFRMKQGFEPTEIPCDTPLMPDEQQKGVISSEISIDYPLEPNEQFKYHSEYEFEDSEQLIDSVKHDDIQTEILETTEGFVESQDSVLYSEDISVSKDSLTELSDLRQDIVSTDTQSEKSESFEELSIPDHSEVIESSHVSSELTSMEQNQIVDDSSRAIQESQLSNVQSAEPCDAKLYEPLVSSDRLEMDQFVFIEQTQDIIDDSYNLYDIQESLVCDLNYVDVKGNIEDECTDDSEQEWKRNEDRKNTLNASFLNFTSAKSSTGDQEDTKFHKSEDQSKTALEVSKKIGDQDEFLKSSEDESQEHLLDVSLSKTAELNIGGLSETESSIGQSYSDFESIVTSNKTVQLSNQSDDIISTDQHITSELLDSEITEVAEHSSLPNELQIISESISSGSGVETISVESEEISSKVSQDLVQTTSSINEVVLAESISPSKLDKISAITESFTETHEISKTELPVPSELYSEISEELSIVNRVLDTDDVYTTEGNYLEVSEEAEIDEIAMIYASIAISDDQPIDVLEDFEASGELSDDNLSTHSSVSTEIAVSLKVASRESEGDECSLNLEQSDNLEDDNEIYASHSETVISDELQDIEQNITEYINVDFNKCSETFDMTFSKEDDFEADDLEYENKFNYKEYKAELTPTPSFESDQQTDRYSPEVLEESTLVPGTLREVLGDEQKEITETSHITISESLCDETTDYVSDILGYYHVFEKNEPKDEIIVSENICSDDLSPGIKSSLSEELTIEKDIVSVAHGSLSTETVLTITDDDETKLSLLENDEMESESLMYEEPIVSHLYDEWYQNVEQSCKFTLLSAESIYAKYGSAESSESGNESDVDKDLSAIQDLSASQDFTNKADSLSESLMDDDKLCDTIESYEKAKIEDVYSEEIESEEYLSNELSVEVEFESVQYGGNFEENIKESLNTVESEISSFVQESIQSISVIEESVERVKDQKINDIEATKNKFSTSKSCQTEDSFEEDVFFDSFDDTFTIPSYIDLPIETQSKPPTTDISIQCELISIEDILSSKKILSSESQKVITLETQGKLSVQDSPIELKVGGEDPDMSELASKEKEESSCESFEDSDSDIFIESPSSQDELDVPTKKGFLYAEVDSDTGFSSGSECGWTKKSNLKQKELKKSSEKSITKVHSLKISTTVSSSEQDVASVETYVIDSQDDNIDRNIETLSITEGNMAAVKIERDNEQDAMASFPSEIIERAVTPVAVPQFPSFEDDLVFLEVEETAEEFVDQSIDDKQKEIAPSTPTVEYFYGPLPENVIIESSPNVNEKFFETASELSESASFSADRTESFSDSSISSMPIAEQISHEVNADVKTTSETKDTEDASFAETSSSVKGEFEDSTSEYYSLPDSSISLASRASLAESDVFDLACSEFFADNGFLVSPEYLPSNNKEEKIPDEKPLSSDFNKIDSLEKIVESSDELCQENAPNVVISAEEIVLPHGTVTDIEENKIVLDQPFCETDTEFVSPGKEDESDNLKKTVAEEQSAESPKLSADESHICMSVDDEAVKSDIILPPSDVPSVPSDIIRYLYYDDSITFDDDSYHTQSDDLKIPSLTSVVTKSLDSADDVAINGAKMEALDAKIDANSYPESLSDTEEKLTSPVTHASVSEMILEDESVKENAEIVSQEFQKNLTARELTKSEIVSLDTNVKISGNITDLASEQTVEPQLDLLEEIQTSLETDLKFSTVEVITSENISILPVTTEQILEPIVLSDQIPESVNITFEDSSTLPSDSEIQNIVEPLDLRQSAFEIPHAPSDIVRYLYYDDDITFDETTQNSFHTQSDNYISDVASKDMPEAEIDIFEYSDIKPTSTAKPEIDQKVEASCLGLSSEIHREIGIDSYLETKPDIFDVAYEQSSSYKQDSSYTEDKSLPPLDSSECIENWFELEEVNGKKKSHDSEQQSSALKDSEQPCIPEYILSPKLDGDMPAAKADIDEVTDISTHFTMTDDSDRFSDIESDTSLNFEEDYILPVEASEFIQIDHKKDTESIEKIVDNEENEMILHTPEVKDSSEGFQFLTSEDLKEEIEKEDFPEESSKQEKFDECVPSKETDVQLSKEQCIEGLTSSEISDQQISNESEQEHSSEDLKEKFDECITSTDFSEISKEQFVECFTDQLAGTEIIQEYVEEDKTKENFESITSTEIIQEYVEEDKSKEKFESITTNDFSEIPKEQFIECLASSELNDQQSSIKYSVDETEEKFDECIFSNENSEISKEQFAECQTLSQLADKKTSKETDLCIALLENVDKQLAEQHLEYVSSDENGNFPEPVVALESISHSLDQADILEVYPSTETHKSSFSDRNEEIDISCSLKESIYVDSLSIPVETEQVQVSPEKQEIDSPQAELDEITQPENDVLETSCYTLPNEDSISTEMTDNWSDADSKNIEVDESIYDLPLEDINSIQLDINIIADETNEKLTVTESTSVKSFELSEKKFIDSKEMDVISSSSQMEQAKEAHTYMTETLDTTIECDTGPVTTTDLNDNFEASTEKEKSEISQVSDSFLFSETFETSSMLHDELIVDKKDDIFVAVISSQQASQQPSVSTDSSLSLDMKLVSGVKMETESEISTDTKDEVYVECMSAASGGEPTFSLDGTEYNAQKVESERISSQSVCLDDKRSAGVLFEADGKECLSEVKIPTDAMMEVTNLVSNVEMFESSTYSSKEAKYVEKPDAEVKFVKLTSVPEFINNKDITETPHIQDDILKLHEQVEEKLLLQSETSVSVDSFNILDTANESFIKDDKIKLGKEELSKRAEVVDFKGLLPEDIENVTEIEPVIDVSVSPDKELIEQVDFKIVSGNIGKKPQESAVETEEEHIDFKGQLAPEIEKHRLETIKLHLKTEENSKDIMKKEMPSRTVDTSEAVDFKGSLSETVEHEIFQFKETSVNEKLDSKLIEEKFVHQITDNISYETVDFKGEAITSGFPENFIQRDITPASASADEIPATIDEKVLKSRLFSDSLETVDFKSLASKDATDPKIVKEIVDFKDHDLADKKLHITQDTKLNLQTHFESFETVDFKGDLSNLHKKDDEVSSATALKSVITEKLETPTEKDKKKKESKNDLSRKTDDSTKLILKKDFHFDKVECIGTLETVDFKGQLSHDFPETKQDVDTSSKIIKEKSEFTKKFETTVEGKEAKKTKESEVYMQRKAENQFVDFKGVLATDELQMHQVEESVLKDPVTTRDIIRTQIEPENVKIENLYEPVDFKGHGDSSYSKAEELGTVSDILSASEDASPKFYTEGYAYEMHTPEICEYDTVYTSTAYDLRETYGMDESGIAAYEPQQSYEYGLEDNVVIYESQQLMFHDEGKTSTFSDYTEESNELYSFNETLSTAEDTSLKFYSISDDFEDTSNLTTSDEFTDVPSHITSIEDSDKWSDVEGDFSLEDAEFEKDKTPIRTEDEIRITRKELTESIDDVQSTEGNVFKFIELKDKDALMQDESVETMKKISGNDLSVKTEVESAQDLESSVQTLEVVSDIESLKEHSKKTEGALELSAVESVKFEMEKGDVLKEHVKEISAVIDLNEKIDEQISIDKISVIATHAISQDLDLKTPSTDSTVVLQDVALCSTEKFTDHSIITASEDFTDVTSNQPSSESYEKWSDVEGELSLEDTEFKKDKSPSKTQNEMKTTEKEPTEVDFQVSEKNVSKSVDLKDAGALISEIVSGDLSIATETEIVKDLKSNLQKLEMVSDLEISEDTKKSEHLSEFSALESMKQLSETKKDDVLKESKQETTSAEDVTGKIDEKISADKILVVEACTSLEESSKKTHSVDAVQESVEAYVTEKHTDYSIIAMSEDYSDVNFKQIFTESSDRSDVERVIEHVEKESEVCIESEDAIVDQIISDDSKKSQKFTETIEDDTETSLREHFADIKSLKDQLTTADTFSSFDAETAVSKTHEDTSTDISSQFEKTESDLWLEAETEHSISEVCEDIAFSVEKDGDTKVVFVEYEKTIDEGDTAIHSSETPYTSTTSSSSYSDFENSDHTSDTYADISLQGPTTESSDKWSDIEAEGLIDDVLYGNIDIKETVELSDISQLIKKPEGSKDISEIPEDNFKTDQLSLEVEKTSEVCSSYSFEVKSEDVKAISDTKSDLFLASKRPCLVEDPDSASVNLDSSAQISIPTESSVLSTTATSVTSAGMSDDELTSVSPLEESDKWSDISGDTSLEEIDDESSVSLKASPEGQGHEPSVVSHEFETSLRSENIEASEIISKKLISEANNSIKNVCEETSVSLKTDAKPQDSNVEVSREFSVNISEKEAYSPVIEDNEHFKIKLDVSKTDKFDRETIHSTTEEEEESSYFYKEIKSTDSKFSVETKDTKLSCQTTDSFMHKTKISEISSEQIEPDVSKISINEESVITFKGDLKLQDLSENEQTRLDKLQSDSNIHVESVTDKEIVESDIHETLQIKSVEASESYAGIKVDYEDSSSSKIIGDSETLDNFTDVPTQISEMSDAYCELESDHSFEEAESPQIEIEDDEELEIQQIADITPDIEIPSDIIAQPVSDYYESPVPNEDIPDADNFALDVIPENELENYEEEYSLSEHFEINEDELIYPLPYNDDWIEQSFELKEYGVEAEFYESGSDIHGLGITNEEYDDDDIQRAIDYNLSTFEENEDNVENIGVTESFKTLSNDASPHLKQEEFETWSTADAPSIEEDFAEQDNVLSKIDELLAEDFDLNAYQADSPLTHESPEDYSPRDICTPEEVCDIHVMQIDSSSLPKETILEIDKNYEVPDFESLSDQTISRKKVDLKAESDFTSKDLSLKKDDIESPKTEFKSDGIEIDKDSKLQLKQESKTASSVIVPKKDSKKVLEVEYDTAISEVTAKKSFTEVTETGVDTLCSNIIVKEDSKKVETKPETIEKTGNDRGKTPKTECGTALSIISTVKDSSLVVETESVTMSTHIKQDSTEAHKTESETLPSRTSCINQDVALGLESDFKAESTEKILKKDSARVTKTESDIISSEVILESDTVRISKTDIVSDEVRSDMTVKEDYEPQFKSDHSPSKEKGTMLLQESTRETVEGYKLSDTNEISSTQAAAVTSALKPSTLSETAEVTSGEMKSLKDEVKEFISSSESAVSISLVSDELTIKSETVKPVIGKEEETSDAEVSTKLKLKASSESSDTFEFQKSLSPENASSSQDASASIVLPSNDSYKQKDSVLESTALSVLKSDSSLDIPTEKLPKSKEKPDELCVESKISPHTSDGTKFVQSSEQLSESLKHSVKLSTETMEAQTNIPDQKSCKGETYSISEQSSFADSMSKEKTVTDSVVVEIKPDIPKKTKRKSLDLKEGMQIKDDVDKRPSLPPKKSKRHSSSDSPSSSFGESLSSSSSVESIGSFESAAPDRSRKSSLKSSDETSMHSLSPDVPARRSRSSKGSSSSRSASRDSDDNSSHSRSSSLKIRRRSSNFIEPEPIDLSKKRASIDERMRKLQNEGKCTTKEKAFIAAKLIEMQFEEEDALLASRQCNTVYHAVKFLTQLCEMCNCRFPINLMSSLVHCTHKACKECLKAHFTSLIYDRSVFTLLCPICHKPDITDQNIQEYFTHLDMTLRNILEDKVYDLFQRKLRDEVLTKDPNFHWCSQCSSGFIASPRLKKLYCPDCSAITCALCHQTWELEHEGVHCERFQQWKDMHTPEPPPAGLVKFLVDRGISCPSCGLLYAQACGGCMMYKCSHCNFEFCGFCIQPLKRGRECSNEICDARGLHIHHFHNCLFFLRDKDITEIQMLLEEESVTYLTIPPKDQIVKSRCQVREQKNVHGVLTEDRCGRDIEPYCGGLCRTHYYEYLAELLRKNKVSPLSIMTIQDLQFMMRKSRILVPEKIKGETSEDYYERLLSLVTRTLT